MISRDANMPKLTDDEQEEVNRISWQISQCKNERDKLFIYNDMLYKLYKVAYNRMHYSLEITTNLNLLRCEREERYENN